LFLEQGRFDEAVGELRQVPDSDPEAPRAHLRLAQVAAARQEWGECLRHLATVGDVPYARKQACSLRLLAFQRLGDAKAAAREQEQLRELSDDPRWPDAPVDALAQFEVGVRSRLTRAGVLLRQGQTQQALSLLEQTVLDYPDSDVAWASLGRTLAFVNRFAEAEPPLERSLELAPNAADAWAVLGLVRLQRKNYTGALECFRTVNRLKPADPEAHCKVAECLLAVGDRPGAIEAYRQALRYQPDFAEARTQLARLQGVP
jgi:tetratricopeptide (TPR) repeat protein